MGADLEVKVLSGGGRPFCSLRQGHHREVVSEGSPAGKLTAWGARYRRQEAAAFGWVGKSRRNPGDL